MAYINTSTFQYQAYGVCGEDEGEWDLPISALATLSKELVVMVFTHSTGAPSTAAGTVSVSSEPLKLSPRSKFTGESSFLDENCPLLPGELGSIHPLSRSLSFNSLLLNSSPELQFRGSGPQKALPTIDLGCILFTFGSHSPKEWQGNTSMSSFFPLPTQGLTQSESPH